MTEFLTGLGIGRYGVLALILLMYLVLGCLMDAMAMVILTVPIVFPVSRRSASIRSGSAIVIVMTVELGLIHPPVGMNVFVIKSVIKDVNDVHHLCRRVAVRGDRSDPAGYPDSVPLLATWLPQRMIG